MGQKEDGDPDRGKVRGEWREKEESREEAEGPRQGGQRGRCPAGGRREGAAVGPELRGAVPRRDHGRKPPNTGAQGAPGSQARARPPASTYCRHHADSAAASPAARATATRGSAGPQARLRLQAPPRQSTPSLSCLQTLLSPPPSAPAPAQRLLYAPISQVEKMSRPPLSGLPPRTVKRAVRPGLRAVAACPFSTLQSDPSSHPSPFGSRSPPPGLPPTLLQRAPSNCSRHPATCSSLILVLLPHPVPLQGSLLSPSQSWSQPPSFGSYCQAFCVPGQCHDAFSLSLLIVWLRQGGNQAAVLSSDPPHPTRLLHQPQDIAAWITGQGGRFYPTLSAVPSLPLSH